MLKKSLLGMLILVLFAVACTGAPPPAPGGNSQPPAPAPSDTPPDTQPATEPAAEEDAYPYPVDNIPAGIINEDAYPAPGDELPAVENGYPAPGDCATEGALPQRVEFPTADGLTLVGDYYPSAVCNAPVVVLFHQYGSSKEAWTEVALWMQNRSDEFGATSAGLLARPAAQSDWLPEMPADLSLAVLAIDFRGHGESPAGDDGFDTEGYLLDAQAALAFAKTLPNVAADQVITIGASIGADASVDACLLLDGTDVVAIQQDQGCIGAMSLSPGSFLDVPYVEVVTRLGETPFTMEIRCVATENDGDSPDICSAGVGDHFQGTIYAGRSEHGTALLMAGLDPDIGGLILNFLLDSLRQ